MELTDNTKIEILKLKLGGYTQQLYGLEIDLKCANAINDNAWIEDIRTKTKRLMQLIELIQDEIATLTPKSDNN